MQVGKACQEGKNRRSTYIQTNFTCNQQKILIDSIEHAASPALAAHEALKRARHNVSCPISLETFFV
jgi:hypothetical protein